MMGFKVIKEGSSCKERYGVLSLSFGEIETPVFMPVGTLGMVKTLDFNDIENLGFKLILNNTYHLYMRPGMAVIETASGIRNLSGWKYNRLTDSGGFQIFSLANLRQYQLEGVRFSSHIDGSKHFFTPEIIIDLQRKIGSQIIMPLDVCTKVGISHRKAIDANNITSHWAKRSKEHWLKTDPEQTQALFGITQGNFYKDLRQNSIEELVELDFPGYSIGGLSVGEEKEMMYDFTDFSTEYLPKDKPRYLMGVGEPTDIIHAVERGIDMFDSVFPTRVARNATVFTENGRLLLRNETNKFDFEPIDKNCNCYVCQNFSKAYLRHLFKANELLVLRLTTIHNLYFIFSLMKNIRKSIFENNFNNFKNDFLKKYLNS